MLFRALAPPFLLAALLASCDNLVGGIVPGVSLALDSPVTGRVGPDDVDEHPLAPPGTRFLLLLRAESGNAADTLRADVLDRNGGVVGSVVSAGSDLGLGAQSSGWMEAPSGARWSVRVRGVRASQAVRYTLSLFPFDPAPERLSSAVQVGRTVEGESLDAAGDVDEFTVSGAEGDEWILFGEWRGRGAQAIEMLLMEPAGEAVFAIAAVGGTGEAIEESSSGRVVLPRSGDFRVRVHAGFGGSPAAGPYRFRIDRVSRTPERAPAALALGQVVEEALDGVGDVDEFTFDAPPGTELKVLAQALTPTLRRSYTTPALMVDLLRGAELVTRVSADTATPSLDSLGGPRLVLDGGTYRVRVHGRQSGVPSHAAGEYRFELYAVDRRPERAGEVRLDGPTVEGAIDRPGDVDEFPFEGRAGQHVVVHGTAPTFDRGWLGVQLVGPAGAVLAQADLSGDVPSHAERHRLAESGTYRLRVEGGIHSLVRSAYTVGAYAVSPAPETGPATLAIGETVEGRIERPGDLDAFTLQGVAGREIALFVTLTDGEGGLVATLRAAGTEGVPSYTYPGPASLDAGSTGRIALEDRPYDVVVDPQWGSGWNGMKEGGYTLRVYEVDRRPERRPAEYVLGDTVRGEPIAPSVDVDEYFFTVDEPTRIRVYWHGPSGDPLRYVQGLLFDAESGRQVWGPGFGDVALEPGRYRFSIRNPNMDGRGGKTASPAEPTLSYRFAIMPVP